MPAAVETAGAHYDAQVAKQATTQRGRSPAGTLLTTAPAALQPLPRRHRSSSLLPSLESSTHVTAEEVQQLQQLLLQLATSTPPSSSFLALTAALGSHPGADLGAADQLQQLASSAGELLQALAAGQLAPSARECRAAHRLLACISNSIDSLPEETHIPHEVLAEAARRGLKWNQRRRSCAADDPAPLGLLFDLRPRGAAEAGMRLKLADWRWTDEVDPPACSPHYAATSDSGADDGSRAGDSHPHRQHSHSHPHTQHRQRAAGHAELADACAQAAEAQAQDLRAQVGALQASLAAALAAEAAAAQHAQAALAAQQQSAAQLAAAAELAVELEVWQTRAEAAEAALASALQQLGHAEDTTSALEEQLPADAGEAAVAAAAAAADPIVEHAEHSEQQHAEQHVPLHRRRGLVILAFSLVLLFTR